MIATIDTATCLGIQAIPVQIEVDVASGLPQLAIVGLPDTSIKEARERVKSAIKNSGYRFPPDRITINLAPAHIKKEGPAFDLPIALGILAATGLIPVEKLSEYLFLGELALDGSLRPFKGAIVVAESLHHYRALVLPQDNAKEASLEKRAAVYAVKNLREVVEFLRGERNLERLVPAPWDSGAAPPPEHASDFSEVRGQPMARRAAEIAAAGAHNLLLIGSPGAGKTMISRLIPSILPPLSYEESLEITKIQSVAGMTTTDFPLVRTPPFRSPHHSISAAAMAGGGGWPKPGEISLAHTGVLFLDELPEFRRDVIETLRAPLEEGCITISRAKMQAVYPCRVMLVAAMNPCPCGQLYDSRKTCRCSLGQIQKYQARLSGPLLDRIDLHVEVPAVSYKTLAQEEPAEGSSSIRKRIMRCREIQKRRYPDRVFKSNALMKPREVKCHAGLDDEGKNLLERAMKELGLSARAYYKIIKIARTLADLEMAGRDEDIDQMKDAPVSVPHIAEAIQFRALDRRWGT
ncbi:MAG TPA: YifB family Mg chelatase-like AAA ATPase [Verrucomicrobiae bacterium]|nr:YifB family Mg chelatase-like AAA ATPase [Verrucomicrobiae bacterium]